MDPETIRLTRAEQQRAYVLNRVLEGELTAGEAAGLLGLSARQVKRLKAAYRRDGPAALAHGNRGRVPWQALRPEGRERVLALARGEYAGLNHSHLTELLAEREGLRLGRSTVRRILLGAGLASPRSRRAPQHRARRERLPREGMLLQADGSRHRWLGSAGPYLTLIGAIDDATGTVPWALFRAQEDAQGYLLLLREVVRTHGVPTALYVDRHGIFVKSAREPLTLEEELAGGRLPTQVARALAELGIGAVHALSPQAKGRVERLWGTLQDRLVAELRLAGATTLAAANAFLPGFLVRFNARFGVPPAAPEPAYRPLPADLDLERVCCFKYARVVRPDNTISFGGRALQLAATPERASWARVQVEVHERLDGSVVVFGGDRHLAVTPAPPDAPTLRARGGPRPGPGGLAAVGASPSPLPPAPAQPSRPPIRDPQHPNRPLPNHPWRRQG